MKDEKGKLGLTWHKPFFLHVGQADDVNRRINFEHSDPAYRKNHNTFSQWTWNHGWCPVLQKPAWNVGMSGFPDSSRQGSAPIGVSCPSPGQHLNVALSISRETRSESKIRIIIVNVSHSCEIRTIQYRGIIFGGWSMPLIKWESLQIQLSEPCILVVSGA